METALPKHTIVIRHNRIVVEVLTRPMGEKRTLLEA